MAFLQLITLAVFSLYLLSGFALKAIAPPVTLHLTAASNTCSAIEMSYPNHTQTLSLSSQPQAYAYTLPPTLQSVYLKPCPGGNFSLSRVSLASPLGEIHYALTTVDLQCYGCQLIGPDTSTVTLSPTNSEPVLVIGNLHEKIPHLLPTLFHLNRYWPPLILSLLLGSLLLPGLITTAGFNLILQAACLTGYLVYRWRALTALFPLPLLNHQQIVAYTQMIAQPVSADTVLFAAVLCLPPLLILNYHYFQRYRGQKTANTLLFNWLLVILSIYVLENQL